MERSETFMELTKALVAAQGEFKPAVKSRTNPLLHNKYATLDDVIEAVRDAMTAHGLCFVQPLSNGGEGNPLLETIIMHESGEWISTSAHIPELAGNKGVNDLQSFGSALTYMRRYMLTSMLGISSEEDGDGNDKPKKAAPPRAVPPQQAAPQQAAPQQTTQSPATHWIEDDKTRANFWAWTSSLTLTHDQVHKALGVASLKEYTGTKADAMDAITTWTNEQADRRDELPGQEETELL